jgi:hypothetical protein
LQTKKYSRCPVIKLKQFGFLVEGTTTQRFVNETTPFGFVSCLVKKGKKSGKGSQEEEMERTAKNEK